MIYDTPEIDDPIRQGDIFCGLPRIEISLGQMDVLVGDNGIQAKPWREIVSEGIPVTAVLGIRPVMAIVITQNCDALRSRDISLCEIRPFQEVEGKAKDTKTTKGWVSIVTQQARLNLKWYYLPPDAQLNGTHRMAADFFTTLRIPRSDLETHRFLRKRRLNSEAEAHFRERIADFFRRYAYNEWYPLNVEEFNYYRGRYPDVGPYPWQQNEPTQG